VCYFSVVFRSLIVLKVPLDYESIYPFLFSVKWFTLIMLCSCGAIRTAIVLRCFACPTPSLPTSRMTSHSGKSSRHASPIDRADFSGAFWGKSGEHQFFKHNYGILNLINPVSGLNFEFFTL